MKKSVLFVPFIPACFAVAALCSPIQAYSIEPATPNDEALFSSVVSTDDDSIEADGAFGKDSLGSTGDAGDITPDDAQTPAAGDDEADTSSPAPDVPAEPSALPSNPQISDFPAADIDEGVYEISNAGSNRVWMSRAAHAITAPTSSSMVKTVRPPSAGESKSLMGIICS